MEKYISKSDLMGWLRTFPEAFQQAFVDSMKGIRWVSAAEINPLGRHLPVERMEKKIFQTSWSDIVQAAEEERLGEILRSGDRLPLVLKNGEDIGLVVGQDSSGKFYFVFANPMRQRRQINSEWTNKGAWKESKMRRDIREEIVPLLPDEVRAVIRPTKIVQIQNGERLETEDELFCLSATQVFGRDERWEELEPEDLPIDIFEDVRNRIRIDSESGSAAWWWLRSAHNLNYFRSVISGGSSYANFANDSGGVVLGFCVEGDDAG